MSPQEPSKTEPDQNIRWQNASRGRLSRMNLTTLSNRSTLNNKVREKVATFDKDLFISYAHVDNLPTPDDSEGWVTRFHKYLEAYLSQSLGEEAKVWRDDRLRGNEIFANEIVKQFPKTAVLLSVLSPRYLESEWCLREVNEFCKSAEVTGGLTIDDKTRVLRAMLKKIPAERREQLPGILKDALGYEFYQETEGKRELPLDPSFGSGETYRRQIYFLAQDIAEVIGKLKQEGVGRPQPDVVPKPTVYLAECSYELHDDREKIRGELKAHGYNVLPDQLTRLPDLEADYVAEVACLLEQCQLSVHVVGKFRGKVPDGPSLKSAVQLQNEVAAQKSEGGSLQRVIWLPEGSHSEQPEQQAFIEALQKVANLQRGADLVTADLEVLKGVIHAALQKLERPERPTSEASASSERLVHLICDKRDRPATKDLRKFLMGAGFDVKIPVFEGDAATVRQVNQDLLTQCDAVILFYGAGDEAWKRTVESDLKKMKGYRAEKPLLASFVYLAAPANDDKKELIDFEEPNLINGIEGFSEAEMQPLVNLLKARKGAKA